MDVSVALLSLALLTQSSNGRGSETATQHQSDGRIDVHATLLFQHQQQGSAAVRQLWTSGVGFGGNIRVRRRIWIGGEVALMKPFKDMEMRQVAHFGPPLEYTHNHDRDAYTGVFRVRAGYVDGVVGSGVMRTHHDSSSTFGLQPFSVTEFCLVFGADLRVPITRRVDATSVFRYYAVSDRTSFLANGDNYRLGFGVAIRFP